MEFLINPNFAYLLIVTAVALALWILNDPKTTWQRAGMLVCVAVAGSEFIYLKGNPLALLVVTLSPLPFFVAIRQSHGNSPLILITSLMLTIGSAFLFVDQDNHPVVNHSLTGPVSVFCAVFIWISSGRLRNVEGTMLSNHPSSLLGLIGQVQIDIEPYSTGSVLVNGELWLAQSKKPISAGATVRVLRQDRFWLTVKKVENLPKK